MLDKEIRNVLRMLGSSIHYCFPANELRDVTRALRAGLCTFSAFNASNHLFRVVPWLGEVTTIYVHLTEKGKAELAKVEEADKRDLRR